MKTVFGIIALLVLGGVVYSLQVPDSTVETDVKLNSVVKEEGDVMKVDTRLIAEGGTYIVITEDSSLTWSGKKPLQEGYINTGSMALKSGRIDIDEDSATGEFVIDMQTLSVSETPTKQGKESLLESHLKGEGWFDVEKFPEAKFVIEQVTPHADSETSFKYDVVGNLTMKGRTHELSFPALIYTDEDGRTYASANLEFDRTLWGITSGSGSFFDDLADNVIDDMVALSFELVTEQE